MSAPAVSRELRLHAILAAAVIAATLAASWNSKLAILWRADLRRGAGLLPAPHGTGPVRDATGTDVPRRDYGRIVVLEGLDLVLSLVPASRVVALDDWSSTHSLEAWRVADRPLLAGSSGIEKILSFSPDLVVMASCGNPETRRQIAGLRSLGVAVFDLAYVIDHDDLSNNIAGLAAVLNVPERGELLSDRLARRIALTRMTLPDGVAPRRVAMLCADGEKLSLFGGDDIFDSIMTDAGLRNATAENGVRLMPAGTLEKMIKIDPEVLVIRPRNRRGVMEFPGLDQLSAGGTKGLVVEIPEPYLGVAVAMDSVDAAEALQDQIYNAGPRRKP